MYYINFSLLFQSVDRVTSSQIIQNNIVDTICLYLVMESKINIMLHIIFEKTTLHPVNYLSPHPSHGFKRQHSIPSITYHLTRITASKDNTLSRQLPITSPESRLQKITLPLHTPALFLVTITNIKPSCPLFLFLSLLISKKSKTVQYEILFIFVSKHDGEQVKTTSTWPGNHITELKLFNKIIYDSLIITICISC